MENLLFEKPDKHIGILKFNRPKALNALNGEMLKELLHFLRNDIKKEEIKILILTGEGEKSFISGADIIEMSSMNTLAIEQFSRLGQNVTRSLEKMDIITIAAVNGYAFGGGLEMALACDFIYCSENAKMGLPEVSLGVIPGFGGTQRLTRAIGARKAKELIFSGKRFDAKEAMELGLVNCVYSRERLLAEAIDTAHKILKNSFYAVLKAKTAINTGQEIALEKALELEKQIFTVCFSAPDKTEGMNAFVEKRKANFSS